MKSLVIPSSITSLGSNVFGNGFVLKIFEIPISATCIDDLTFYNPRYSTLFISGEGECQGGIYGDDQVNISDVTSLIDRLLSGN